MKIIKTQETLNKEVYKKFRDKVIKKIKDEGYDDSNRNDENICIQKEKGIFQKSYFLDIDYNDDDKLELRIPQGHNSNKEDIKFFKSLEVEANIEIVRYI